jgi:nucleoside-diphosphate-sugar epimerase
MGRAIERKPERKRVLVTGGAGYIGCAVVEALITRGHEPVVFDTFYWGSEAVSGLSEDVELVEGDCRNSRDVIHVLEGIDAVLHLAGIVGEAACLENPKAHFSTNVESTRTLINCCTDPELDLVRDFIYSSSCSVYGNVHGVYTEVREDTPPFPLSAYAHAKLRSEQIILARGEEIPHFHPTILRLTTVFGWSGRPRLDLVTNLFAYRAWSSGEIPLRGTGEQYRSLIHVKDVASAFVDTLDAPRFMRDGRIFHVGDQANSRTVMEIAETVKSLLPETIIRCTTGPTDRRDYRIDCRRFQNTIGWQARYTIEDGIKEMIGKFEELDWNWEEDRFRNSSYSYL